MNVLFWCVLPLLFNYVTPQLFCLNKCSCTDIDPSTDILLVFGTITDCCDAASSSARGNIAFDGNTVTACTLCPSKCIDCKLGPLPPNDTYHAAVTRPTAGAFLYRVEAQIDCSDGAGSLSVGYTRRGSDVSFITVNSLSGRVSIVIANAPNEKRIYYAEVQAILYRDNTVQLDEQLIPISFEVYDAIEANATEYTATTTNSRVGGLYLFTIASATPNYTIIYSIKPFIGNPKYIFIDPTTGQAVTSTTEPPLVDTDYVGVILLAYTSDLDPSLTGIIEVQFLFTIVLPLTPDPTYNVFLPFPASTPQDILAFTIAYSFFPGFSFNSFTYDFIDTADLLHIGHTTGRFNFPFDSDTEVKRYPDSGVTEIFLSYFSTEMYVDTSTNSNENVYKGSISVYYSIMVIDACGFSESVNATCENAGVCTNDEMSFICNCTDFFLGDKCETDVNECLNLTFCNTGSCANTYGGFTCSCPPEFTGENCYTDVDECDFSPPICSNGGVCSNSYGGYWCDCTGTGYEGENCEDDINECSENATLCSSGVCVNTDGSFFCNCSETGFTGELCERDIDECTEQPGLCNNGNCTNEQGSYVCNCETGYTGDNCESSIDECAMDTTLCAPGVCNDTDGSYTCDCADTGFHGQECTMDIDECFSTPSVCLNEGLCINEIGSYTCNCTGTGYTGGDCSIDINECLLLPPVCTNNGTCINSQGDYSCDCASTGYEGNNCEVNINECERTAGICGTGQCQDTEGAYMCMCVGTGFMGLNCEIDINECHRVPNVCENGGNCSNLIPFYSCDCDGTGYAGTNCQMDVNECTDTTLCNNGTCINNNGSFACVCNEGYTGRLCDMDINECEETPGICNNGTCSNTPGSFSCGCYVGYAGLLCDGDVDECTSIPGLCSPGVCSNSIGSYACNCTDTGYTGQNCQEDIDECVEETDICNEGNCTNSNGSFSCSCFSGYTGTVCNMNINECENSTGLCNNGTCIDIEGSYMCACPAGITGLNCEEDINECLDTALCTPGICYNTVGSYICDCSNTGFEGRNCTKDINECLDTTLCGTGTCRNVPGSFSCNCTDTGFNGTLCMTDINECETPSLCLNSGACVNIPGSYTCVCIPGYTGRNCEDDINECNTANICNQGTCINTPGSYMCSCPAGTTGATCNVSANGTALCPANMECTADSDCMTCLCHRNFSYIEPVYVLLPEPIEFDGDMLLPFEREVQPEIVSDVTIFAKLRQNSSDQGYVMFIGSSTVYRNLGLYLDSNVSTAYLFYTRAGANTYTTVSISLDVVGPEEHTLAVVLNFTGGEATFYKDGVLVNAPITLSGPPDYKLGETKNNRLMYVGGRIENLFKFMGWMSYVFLYPFSLTPAQIKQLHDDGPIQYNGAGRCREDIDTGVCAPRPFYQPSVPTQHHSHATKSRCESSHYSSRGLNGMYSCSQASNVQECSVNSDCPSGHACGEYLSRDGHSLIPAVFDSYFHGFKYALVEQRTEFYGFNPITISITKRPILTRDMTIFVRFQQTEENEGYVVAKGVSAHARDFGLYLRGTSDTVWFVYKSKTGFHDYAIFSDINVDDGLVHTMAAVLLQTDDSRFVYLYVDGIPRGGVKINNRVVFTPEINRLFVGGRPGTDKFNFDGVIYKLHIFDVALSYSVISHLHTSFSNDMLVRYCTPLQSAGDSCYIEKRPPFFKCDSDLGCVPGPHFNRTHPILPQQNICYGVPYTVGQCLSCDCPDTYEPVCGTNAVTYANDCFLNCAGATLLTQGPCLSYSARFDAFAGGSE